MVYAISKCIVCELLKIGDFVSQFGKTKLMATKDNGSI